VGSFTIDVARVEATLTLRASASVVTPGMGVTFTAGVAPVTFGQYSMPFQVQQWTWVPDTGNQTGPGCGTLVVCPFTPQTSGVMILQGIANGEPQTVSHRVRVNTCPPANDSTGKLDDPDFRKILFDELVAGRTPPGGPFSERVGYTFRMPDGSVYYQPSGANATDCNVLRLPPTYPPGGTIEDLIHVHPVGIGEKWVTCKQPGAGGGTKFMDYPPSTADHTLLTELLNFNANGNLWLITGADNIFQVDASGTLRQWKKGSNGCIAARII
jgi:hypothetical protein